MYAIFNMSGKVHINLCTLRDSDGCHFRNKDNDSYFITNKNIIAYGTLHKLKTNYPEYFI